MSTITWFLSFVFIRFYVETYNHFIYVYQIVYPVNSWAVKAMQRNRISKEIKKKREVILLRGITC